MTAWGFGDGNDKTFTMPSAVNDGAWHQVVLTYNGTTLTLYIDGVALAAQAATRDTVMDAYGFGIGAVINPGDANSGGFFNGSIDEVSFYTTVLSQATVTDHYQLGTASAPSTRPARPAARSTPAAGRHRLPLLDLDHAEPGAWPRAPTRAAWPRPATQLLRATATLTGTAPAAPSAATPSSPVGPTRPPRRPTPSPTRPATATGTSSWTRSATPRRTPARASRSTPPRPRPRRWPSRRSPTPSGPAPAPTVYYRSAATSGSFTATATATDAASGIASYAFPALGTNWTSTPGALGVNTYSWTGAPAAPGTKNVTATNNASLVSANAPFTLTADDTAPTAGTVTYADASQTSTVGQRDLHDRHRRRLRASGPGCCSAPPPP